MNRRIAHVVLTLVTILTLLSVAISSVAAQGNADLSITGVADRDKLKVGQDIIYTITVTNSGPNVATGVNFGFMLPDQFTPISFECSEGGSGFGESCTIGDLQPGTTVSAVLVARVCCLPKGETRRIWIGAYVNSDNDPNIDNDSIYTWTKIIGGWNMK